MSRSVFHPRVFYRLLLTYRVSRVVRNGQQCRGKSKVKETIFTEEKMDTEIFYRFRLVPRDIGENGRRFGFRLEQGFRKSTKGIQ